MKTSAFKFCVAVRSRGEDYFIPHALSMKPTLSRCNRHSLAGIFFATNCCQWLDPIHLHRSPLKRDADELNESANYAHSVWGACCKCNFGCLFTCMHIPNFMHVHSYVYLCMCINTWGGGGANSLTITRENMTPDLYNNRGISNHLL